MPSNEQHSDVLRRLKDVENKLDNLEIQLGNQAVRDAELGAHLDSIRREFDGLRTDVISTVTNHTDHTWKLIHRGIYVIGFLIIAIVGLVGVKLAPELIKGLM